MKHLADVDENCYAHLRFEKLESSVFDEMIIDPTHFEQDRCINFNYNSK